MAKLQSIAWAVAGWSIVLIFPILWGISYLHGDAVAWLRGGHTSILLFSSHGDVGLVAIPEFLTANTAPVWYHFSFDGHYGNEFSSYVGTQLTSFDHAGIKWQRYTGAMDRSGTSRASLLIVKWWLLGVPALLWAAIIVLNRIRRSLRYGEGHCQRCGYDLRASPDRCPECGAVVPGDVPSTAG